MDSQIVAIFCLCDDLLKGWHHHDDPQCKMSDAEVMTTSIVAAVFFGGNMETAQTFLKEQGYIPKGEYPLTPRIPAEMSFKK